MVTKCPKCGFPKHTILDLNPITTLECESCGKTWSPRENEFKKSNEKPARIAQNPTEREMMEKI